MSTTETPDPVVRLLVQEAAARSSGTAALGVDDLVIIGLDDAASLAVVEALHAPGARVFADTIPQQSPAPAPLRRELPGPSLLGAARLVLLRLPKSLAELEEFTGLVRRHADPDVLLLAGGRQKHLSLGMNALLEADFASVAASLGRWKSRVLVARDPRPGMPDRLFPLRARVEELGFDVFAHGGAFAGPRLDLGTRVLLDVPTVRGHLAGDAPQIGRVLDLGCGTGVLATAFARHHPDVDVVASDRSWAACASARATADAAGVGARVAVRQEDAAAGVQGASIDLVLLNPPFHDGHAVDERLADRLFAAAARVLRPGGRLLTVYNSHLRHRGAVERMVGATRQIARTSKFTVTESVRD